PGLFSRAWTCWASAPSNGCSRQKSTIIPFLNTSRRGGKDTESLPILLGRLAGLPRGLDALLFASDLQGVVPDWRAGGEARLLGERLVDVYVKLYEEGIVPSPHVRGPSSLATSIPRLMRQSGARPETFVSYGAPSRGCFVG